MAQVQIIKSAFDNLMDRYGQSADREVKFAQLINQAQAQAAQENRARTALNDVIATNNLNRAYNADLFGFKAAQIRDAGALQAARNGIDERVYQSQAANFKARLDEASIRGDVDELSRLTGRKISRVGNDFAVTDESGKTYVMNRVQMVTQIGGQTEELYNKTQQTLMSAGQPPQAGQTQAPYPEPNGVRGAVAPQAADPYPPAPGQADGRFRTAGQDGNNGAPVYPNDSFNKTMDPDAQFITSRAYADGTWGMVPPEAPLPVEAPVPWQQLSRRNNRPMW